METTRRDFLKLLAAFGLVVGADGTLVSVAGEQVTGLRKPAVTGILTPVEKGSLWRVFDYIGKAWGNASLCTLNQGLFEAIIDLKTTRPPSYLSEYRQALTRFDQLCRDGDEATVLQRLYFGKGEPRLRRYVLTEFIHLQLAHGGFRFLGYDNYKGHMGGMLNDRQHLPYRVAGGG